MNIIFIIKSLNKEKQLEPSSNFCNNSHKCSYTCKINTKELKKQLSLIKA